MKTLTGVELNAEIAVRIMRTHTVWDRRDGTDEQREWGKLVDVSNGALRSYNDVPDYSTSIEAAWLVVEKLRAENMILSVNWGKDGGWWAVIYPVTGSPIEGEYANTAPLAICDVALGARKNEEETRGA